MRRLVQGIQGEPAPGMLDSSVEVSPVPLQLRELSEPLRRQPAKPLTLQKNLLVKLWAVVQGEARREVSAIEIHNRTQIVCIASPEQRGPLELARVDPNGKLGRQSHRVRACLKGRDADQLSDLMVNRPGKSGDSRV